MLKMNLTHLSKEELADAVSLYCAELGLVKSVAILHPEKAGAPRAFALVTMSSLSELEAVANTFGDGQIGTMAIIRLEQEEQSIPNSLLRKNAVASSLAPN